MLAASADFSPGRVKMSPSEPLLAANQVPAKPKASEPSIAVQSTFYDWSCEYFMEPQMKVSCRDLISRTNIVFDIDT